MAKNHEKTEENESRLKEECCSGLENFISFIYTLFFCSVLRLSQRMWPLRCLSSVLLVAQSMPIFYTDELDTLSPWLDVTGGGAVGREGKGM